MKKLMAGVCVMLCASCVWAAPRNLKGQVFAKIPASGECPAVELKFDAVLPEGGEKHPCLVFFFGGAWFTGSRSQIPSCMTDLAKQGWVVVASDYRLTQGGKCPFPAQILDCKEMVRFLRRNAKDYNIDPERIYVTGVSAGGHLASLVGVTSGIDPFSGKEVKSDPDSRVAGVIDIFGPSDMSKMAPGGPDCPPAFSGPLGPTLRNAFIAFFNSSDEKVVKDLAPAASPIHYVTKARAKDIPPFLIMHSDKDPIVPCAQSVAFDKALKGAGVKCELKTYHMAEHNLPPEGWNDFTAYMLSLDAKK